MYSYSRPGKARIMTSMAIPRLENFRKGTPSATLPRARIDVNGSRRGCNHPVSRCALLLSGARVHFRVTASAPSSTRLNHLPAFCAASCHPSNWIPNSFRSPLQVPPSSYSPVPQRTPYPRPYRQTSTCPAGAPLLYVPRLLANNVLGLRPVRRLDTKIRVFT